jgi:hypothetical protein
MTCIADDITECDCDKCLAAEERWQRKQGWHDDDRIDDELRNRCVLGDECLVADPYHGADECFDVEIAKRLMGGGAHRLTGRQRTRELWRRRGRR